MITEQHLHEATPRVLQRLQNLVTLPSKGTVGGQAVASLFFEELGLDIRGPINDVDIFVPLSLDPNERGVTYNTFGYIRKTDTPPHLRNPTARIGQTLYQDGGQGYNHVKFICARSNVTIMRTYKDGLRNFTLVKHASDTKDAHGMNVSEDIINGFDLNLVQVGINIAHNTVVFSPNFLEFLNTKQLKVATCNTPTHTLIRLTSKHFGGGFHNVLCDYEREKSLLVTYLQLVEKHRSLLSKSSKVVEDVGQKYTQMAREHTQRLPNLIASPEHPSLFRFECAKIAPSQHFNDLDVLFSSANNESFQNSIDAVFIADFPKVFSIVQNKDTQPDKWSALQTAVGGTLSTARTIDAIQVVLHGQNLLYSRMKMPENDSVLFFHQQKTNKDSNKVNAIIDQYNQFSAIERLLLRRNQVRADNFDQFVCNKESLCAKFVNEDIFLSLLDVGEEAKNRTEMDEFFNTFINIQRTSGERETDVVSSLDDKTYNMFAHTQFPTRSVVVFQHYAPPEKLQKIKQLFELMSQPFQIKAALDLVVMAHANGVYDGAWWNNDFWFMENAFVDFLRSKPPGHTKEQLEFVQHMLNHVTDAQLMDQNGVMLRNILQPHCYDMVRDRVARMDQRWHASDVLRCMCTPIIHLRSIGAGPELNTDLLSKLVLELELAPTMSLARERRKM